MAFHIKRSWITARHLLRFYHLKPGEENLCIACLDTNDMELVSMPIVEPKEDEALIRVDCNSISPKDFDLWRARGGSLGQAIILGTCAAGTIVKTGSPTSNELKEGARVTIEPGLCCLKCIKCAEGRTNLCPNMVYVGSESKHGTLAKFVTHPLRFCHKIDDKVTFNIGSLIARIASAVHCYERAQIKANSKVLIFGCGLKGLLSLIAFKKLGVGSVIVAEESNYRLNLAKKLGADYVLKIAPKDSPEYPEYLQQILHAIYSEKPQIAIDTVCTPYSIQTVSHMTQSGGKLILMSFMTTPSTGPFMRTFINEIDCIGSYSYTRESFQKALKLVAENVSHFEKLEYFKVPLDRTIDAFSYARATSRENMFILVKVGEDINQNQTGSNEKEDRKTGFKRTDPLENDLVKDIVNNLEANNEIESFEESLKNSIEQKQTSSINLQKMHSNTHTKKETDKVQSALNNIKGSEEMRKNTSEGEDVNLSKKTRSEEHTIATKKTGTKDKPSKSKSDSDEDK